MHYTACGHHTRLTAAPLISLLLPSTKLFARLLTQLCVRCIDGRVSVLVLL
jgi:hypothetical protein